MYGFSKPEAWPYMTLFDKIGYYRTKLDERFAPFVDKLSVKEIVQSMSKDVEVARVVRILDGPHDIHPEDLSGAVIIKASHGSGWNINVSPETTVDYVKTQLSKWNRTYDTESPIEQHYKHIKPRFYIEEIIDDYATRKSGNARVFMFRCLHGKPISVGVRQGSVQNSYDIDFKPLKTPLFSIEKPAAYERMISVAKSLSAPFEFVRIDLYLGADDKIYLSEFTFTPAAGYPFFPMKLEHQYGRQWK
jgi:hypothetical protein